MVEEVDKVNNEFPENTETIDTNHLDDLNHQLPSKKNQY